jgi:putative cardiolipin synthase
MISPYFVPGERGTAFLEDLAKGGVRVRVLTNSLEATDVGVVHTGYAKRRCDLARAGVRFYELKATAEDRNDGRREAKAGSSGHASLHAKTVRRRWREDLRRLVQFRPALGPCSIRSSASSSKAECLAGRLATAFDETVPANAYEVRVQAEGGCVAWFERTGQGEIRHDTEPGTTWLKRLWLGFVGLLPIDWML